MCDLRCRKFVQVLKKQSNGRDVMAIRALCIPHHRQPANKPWHKEPFKAFPEAIIELGEEAIAS
jgi:hypothetical protein